MYHLNIKYWIFLIYFVIIKYEYNMILLIYYMYTYIDMYIQYLYFIYNIQFSSFHFKFFLSWLKSTHLTQYTHTYAMLYVYRYLLKYV